MIVLNSGAFDGDRFLGAESRGPRRDFASVLDANGYRLLAREPKYRDPALQRFGVSPTEYALFELR
jgi:hypothetical protein